MLADRRQVGSGWWRIEKTAGGAQQHSEARIYSTEQGKSTKPSTNRIMKALLSERKGGRPLLSAAAYTACSEERWYRRNEPVTAEKRLRAPIRQYA
jgi:hypothetical protein